MTNQIEAENHDFKIMTNISSGTISQYPTEETYFPEELIDKMTGLDGVEKVSKVTGGYGSYSWMKKFWIFEERRWKGIKSLRRMRKIEKKPLQNFMNLWQNRSVIPIWKN